MLARPITPYTEVAEQAFQRALPTSNAAATGFAAAAARPHTRGGEPRPRAHAHARTGSGSFANSAGAGVGGAATSTGEPLVYSARYPLARASRNGLPALASSPAAADSSSIATASLAATEARGTGDDDGAAGDADAARRRAALKGGPGALLGLAGGGEVGSVTMGRGAALAAAAALERRAELGLDYDAGGDGGDGAGRGGVVTATGLYTGPRGPQESIVAGLVRAGDRSGAVEAARWQRVSALPVEQVSYWGTARFDQSVGEQATLLTAAAKSAIVRGRTAGTLR
jgi:hypothetical protein